MGRYRVMQYYILILDAIRLVLFLVDKRWRGAVIYVAVFGGSLRLERGAWLLVLTQKSVSEVTGMVEYANPSKFAVVFLAAIRKSSYGISKVSGIGGWPKAIRETACLLCPACSFSHTEAGTEGPPDSFSFPEL